jgi:hypothetical protein
MLQHELDEAITAIEECAANGRTPKLSQHRWKQMLRILKFYRLRWDTLSHDPAWNWRQDHPISPYFRQDKDYSELKQYYKENPTQCIEPPADN